MYGENTRVYAGINTNVYNNDNLRANLYSVRLCSPDDSHRLANCVVGRHETINSFCPHVGCFGWKIHLTIH